jgi:hypothetical protein
LQYRISDKSKLHFQDYKQLFELQNKCASLAQQYLKDLTGLDLYQDFCFPQKSKKKKNLSAK